MRRRICLLSARSYCGEQVRHLNRIKGLLAGQGKMQGSIPCTGLARQLLDAARTGDGRPLPNQLRAEILREIELIGLLVRQIADVEAERELLVGLKASKTPSPIMLLQQLKEEHRSGDCLSSVLSRSLPKLWQPPPIGRLRWARANTVAQRYR